MTSRNIVKQTANSCLARILEADSLLETEIFTFSFKNMTARKIAEQNCQFPNFRLYQETGHSNFVKRHIG